MGQSVEINKKTSALASLSNWKGSTSCPCISCTRILAGKGREVLVASDDGAQPIKASKSRPRVAVPRCRKDRISRRAETHLKRQGNELGLKRLLCTQLLRFQKTCLCSSLFCLLCRSSSENFELFLSLPLGREREEASILSSL